MNQVQLIGHSGFNAELKYTQSGMAVANISIATNEKVKEQTVTSWHKVIIFGKTAEMSVPRIKKGTEVFVAGKLQSRDWTDKEGVKKTSVEIVASWVRIIERPPSAPEGGRYAEGQSSIDSASNVSNDDISF